jgi:hypothetical protein
MGGKWRALSRLAQNAFVLKWWRAMAMSFSSLEPRAASFTQDIAARWQT